MCEAGDAPPFEFTCLKWHNEDNLSEKPFPGLDLQFHRLSKPDIERMDIPTRRRYLGRRLSEIEWLIQSVLFRRTKPVDVAALDATDRDRAEWEKIMDLNYLEASRQAILQALIDLSWPAGASWSTSENFLEIMEGARARGPIGRN